ncbi:hypothetical protein ColTof4_14378 [Colletotrichum tofieldiae]|nr:hypothetical protein ColTof3_14790 [Colletotrichum tofieldiae]GKT81955.1 hypothetical protein ColTof4_14378 [Colletotrichum tofieldiae]
MDALVEARESRKAGKESDPVISDMPGIKSPEDESALTINQVAIIPDVKEHEHHLLERDQQFCNHNPQGLDLEDNGALPSATFLPPFEYDDEKHDGFMYTEEQPPEKRWDADERRGTHFLAQDRELGYLTVLSDDDEEPDILSLLSLPMSSLPPLR